MSPLPRLLYLFMSLTVKIHHYQFHEWDKQVSRFIWKGEKPRAKYSTLMTRKEKGSVSLQNLYDYYLAANLKTIIQWCDGG